MQSVKITHSNQGNALVFLTILTLATALGSMSALQIANKYVNNLKKTKAKNETLNKHAFLLQQLSEWLRSHDKQVPVLYPSPFPSGELLKQAPILRLSKLQIDQTTSYVPNNFQISTPTGLVKIGKDVWIGSYPVESTQPLYGFSKCELRNCEKKALFRYRKPAISWFILSKRNLG